MVDWWFHLKRFLIILALALIIGALIVLVPYLIISTPPNLPPEVEIPLISANLGMMWFFEGALLMLFGGCQAAGFTEKLAIMRYAVDPQVTRDTVRHYDERRRGQQRSGPSFFLAGLTLIILASLLLTFLPF